MSTADSIQAIITRGNATTPKQRILRTIDAFIDDPEFEQKIGALEKPDGSNALAIQTIIEMKKGGVLRQFAEWDTHENSGFRHFKPSEKPPSQPIKKALDKIAYQANEAIKQQVKDGIPESKLMDDFMGKFKRRAILGGAAGALVGAIVPAESNQERYTKIAVYSLYSAAMCGVPDLLFAMHMQNVVNQKLAIKESAVHITVDKTAVAASNFLQELCERGLSR